jgi:hypothetical protein
MINLRDKKIVKGLVDKEIEIIKIKDIMNRENTKGTKIRTKNIIKGFNMKDKREIYDKNMMRIEEEITIKIEIGSMNMAEKIWIEINLITAKSKGKTPEIVISNLKIINQADTAGTKLIKIKKWIQEPIKHKPSLKII